ncbi:MAG: DUF86 domain-containing protein [Candidatus Freyarchaeota archaeon]
MAKVREYLDMLEVYLENLKEVVSPLVNIEEFTGDASKFFATQHLLQICIQILIDMALKIVSLKGLKTPKEYGELAEIFEKQGALTSEESKIFRKMIEFRNLMVHVYPRVDPKIVFHIAKNEAERDLRMVASKLAQFAEKTQHHK